MQPYCVLSGPLDLPFWSPQYSTLVILATQADKRDSILTLAINTIFYLGPDSC